MASGTAANLNPLIARRDGDAGSGGVQAGPGWHLCKRAAFGFESGQRRSPNLRRYALGFSLPTPGEAPESRGPLSPKKEITPCPLATMTGSP